jgi:uncharacterized DUF497 family protein
MQFEWDPAKAERNRLERGLPFELATRLFDGPVVEATDPRDWDETRIKAIGVIDGREYVVVYVDRGERRRIISLRDAAAKERRLYWEALRRSADHG